MTRLPQPMGRSGARVDFEPQVQQGPPGQVGPPGSPGTPGGAILQDWQPNAPIKANEMRRLPDGSLARWNQPDGVTGATFTAANWVAVSGGGGQVKTGTVAPVTLNDGDLFVLQDINGNTTGVFTAPGPLDAKVVVSSAPVPTSLDIGELYVLTDSGGNVLNVYAGAA